MRDAKNILVIYEHVQFPFRASVKDYLYSFKRYSSHNVFYLNTAYRDDIPSYLKKIKMDLIIFHSMFASTRFDKGSFERAIQRNKFFRDYDAIKVFLPQDEFLNTDLLCEFISDFKIDIIFSVGPESEWGNIYNNINFNKVKIYKVLTGYLDEKTIIRINNLKNKIKDRNIDIGYRAWHALPWLGRHGLIKTNLSILLNKKKLEYPQFIIDSSTKLEDTLYGDKWFHFLLMSKCTIGVEGGTSMLDRDGTIKDRTIEYMDQNPWAKLDEIERNCFYGLDGNVNYVAISPRHLEACLTETCQILVEGEYNGILKPGIHYLELKRDFSNIDEILSMINRKDLREEITSNAYKDIVQSGSYTYNHFVDFVINRSFECGNRVNNNTNLTRLISSNIKYAAYCIWNNIGEVIHNYKIKKRRAYRNIFKRYSFYFNRLVGK